MHYNVKGVSAISHWFHTHTFQHFWISKTQLLLIFMYIFKLFAVLIHSYKGSFDLGTVY